MDNGIIMTETTYRKVRIDTLDMDNIFEHQGHEWQLIVKGGDVFGAKSLKEIEGSIRLAQFFGEQQVLVQL